MFTGIIEAVAKVQSARFGEDGVLSIALPEDWQPIPGESIAVNGVCLTVTVLKGNVANFDVSPETVDKTSLSSLAAGVNVNLERAVKAGGRMGGHIVTGHVEGCAKLVSITPRGSSRIFRVEVPKELMRDIIQKGSVTLDGISLTVAALVPGGFEIAVIGHTLANTVLPERMPGSLLNIETDILGKYARNAANPQQGERVTDSFLKENGFM
jgi:riboflavin synthase